MSPDAVADALLADLQLAQQMEPRTMQAVAGKIGVSDIGGCRERVRLTLLETPHSDVTDKTAAMFGTAWHEYVAKRIGPLRPGWLIEGRDDNEVLIYLPGSPDPIIGHFDRLDVAGNAVHDDKTKDGLALIEGKDPDEQMEWQIQLYIHGLISDGRMSIEGAKGYLIFWDRSGATERPHVKEVLYDYAKVEAAAAWLSDVAYALRHDEEASKDVAVERCFQICPFASTCRGDLSAFDAGLLTDETIVDAAEQYLRGHELEKQGKKIKEAAKAELVGFAGTTSTGVGFHFLNVNTSEVPGYTRRAYSRIQIKRVK